MYTMKKYTKIKVLGHGAFGKAWLVSDNVSLQAFVIKEISIPVLKERDKQQAINEVKILATLKHKNIILYKEAFVHEKCLCICMEYANDGDLSEKIKKQNGRLFMELQIIDWFVQILIAVKYIHGLNILHRDLKSQNIFLTTDGFVKIGDFGVSRCLDGGLEQAKTAIGTPYYLSPEICQQKSYDHKSDMWSLGVLIYELATLKHPFVANDFQNLIVKIVKGKYPPIPGCFGPLVQDLVLILLQVSPEHRPSASQLLKAPSLQQHVRSYLLRVRNIGRSAPSERSKSASIEKLEEIKPVSSRLNMTNLQDSSVTKENYYWKTVQCPNQKIESQSQTDSAYDSDSEQISDSAGTGHSASNQQTSPVEKYKMVVDQISNEITNKKESGRDVEEYDVPVFVRRRDMVTEKRQSYLEAIAATDQSIIESELNRTYDNILPRTQDKCASEGGKSAKEGPSKQYKLKTLRRRSCDVESITRASSKSKLPRRLSMDSIGHNDENYKNDETIKPKRRSSLSTLKKFIRRNSKSTDDTAKKSTTNNASKISSTNHGPVKSRDPSSTLTAATPNRENQTKQTKCSINFIERNRKLAETPKSKAPKKVSEKSEKQDKKGKPKKLANLSEAPEQVMQSVPDPSLLSTYIIKNDKANDFLQPIPKVPLLRKRSMTFDHKKTFLKFGQNDTMKSDATELDCIVVGAKFQPPNTKTIQQDSSKTEPKKKEKKKVRHQSSNVFPDGFRVKETVKQRILGRLRAASQSSDSNTEKPKKFSDGQNSGATYKKKKESEDSSWAKCVQDFKH